MATVECCTPRGEAGREECGVVECDSPSDGGFVGEERVDAMWWLVVGEEDG
jgi:hypothetical protein